MSRWRVCCLVLVVVVVASTAGCTKPNPQSCLDGTCTDPAFPFCDLDGALAGEDQTCIAVACTADEFVACRGDRAITCNTTGTDYELVQCGRGCDEGTGCRVCDPGETVCENGKVQTCDANGAVTSSESCPLGCFEDQPRCRELVPSNNLGAYLDMVAAPPDIDLAAASFDTATGVVKAGTQTVSVPSFLHNTAGNGASIRVFVTGSLKLNSASIFASGNGSGPPGPAAAFVARGDIFLSGEILIHYLVGGAVLGCNAPGNGNTYDAGSGRFVAVGGGGGGNGTDGADGGVVLNAPGPAAPSNKGTASGTPGLVPLRGGCAGGYPDNSGSVTYANGGGAIQLTSTKKITVDATVDARGSYGYIDHFDQTNAFLVGGGGAGGSILLEAPQLMLGRDASLLATGGSGAESCTAPSSVCAAKGAGATGASPASAGGSVQYTSTANTIMSGGGGGGGLGRLRINTRDGTYAKENTAIEAAVISTGTLVTR